MYIHRQQGLLATEQENASRGFRPNPLKAVQPCRRSLYRQFAEEIKAEVASLLSNLMHDRLQSGSFHFRKADICDSILHFLSWCIAYRFPRAEMFQEVRPCSSSLLISRAVREENIHQHTHRVFA